MKTTRFYFLSVLSVLAAVFSLTSCKEGIEGVYDPETGLVTIPYSIRLSSLDTKVSFADNPNYGVKSGDVIVISGTDISGTLTYTGGIDQAFSGSLSYEESTYPTGPADDTPLHAVLKNADNLSFDGSDYSAAVASDLQTAVEKFSCFTGDFTFGTPSNVRLNQQSAFVTATITFNFENGNFHLTGETSMDVIVSPSLTIYGTAVLAQVGSTNSYSTSFAFALPGGTTLTSDSVIQLCDRDFQLATSDKVVARNNKYSFSDELDFHPQLGDPFWSDGTYGRIAHDPGVVVTGIIVFVNNYEDSNLSELAVEARALTEKASGYGHALVMSLKNAGAGVKWTNNSGNNALNGAAIKSPSEILGTSNVSGYSNTQTLIANAANTAANTAYNYRSGEGDTMTGTSGWFLPSIGQWVYSISTRGFGGAAPAEDWLVNESYKNWLTKGELSNLVLVKNNGSATENLLVTSLNNRLQLLYDQFGCDFDSFGMTSEGAFSDNYWSSSEYDASNAIRMNFGSVETHSETGDKYSSIKTNYLSKQSTSAWKAAFVMKVRPFLAF
ncbi:MAG: hypothetical protein IK030_01290 [Bacteroidales bacterium]|nr:hypothetical protein [Bacteroidales bacterium]